MTTSISRLSIGVAGTVGRSAFIKDGRDERDVGWTVLRIFDFTLIVVMVAAPFL